MVADPQPHHPDRAARAARARTTRRSGTTARRRAAQDDHARSGRASSQQRLADAAHHRRLGDALCQSRRPRSRIRALQEQGCDRILLVPLYPQYAAATTATACDQAFRALMKMRWQPAVRVAPAYHDDPVYIDALAAVDAARPCRNSISSRSASSRRFTACRKSIWRPATPIIASARKLRAYCVRNSALPPEKWLTTFQSRFGNDPWLQPYTDETVKRLASEGVKRIALVAPGFSADCLETLEELDGENRAVLHARRRRKVRLSAGSQRQRGGRRRHRGDRAPRTDGLGLSRPSIGLPSISELVA